MDKLLLQLPFDGSFVRIVACNFDGQATILTKDPSNGSCVFPIEIYSGGTMLRGGIHTIRGILTGFVLIFLTFI
jgi:hypothetical protein